MIYIVWYETVYRFAGGQAGYVLIPGADGFIRALSSVGKVYIATDMYARLKTTLADVLEGSGDWAYPDVQRAMIRSVTGEDKNVTFFVPADDPRWYKRPDLTAEQREAFQRRGQARGPVRTMIHMAPLGGDAEPEDPAEPEPMAIEPEPEPQMVAPRGVNLTVYPIPAGDPARTRALDEIASTVRTERESYGRVRRSREAARRVRRRIDRADKDYVTSKTSYRY